MMASASAPAPAPASGAGTVSSYTSAVILTDSTASSTADVGDEDAAALSDASNSRDCSDVVQPAAQQQQHVSNKRPASGSMIVAESSKKRRKQSTPVRIQASSSSAAAVPELDQLEPSSPSPPPPPTTMTTTTTAPAAEGKTVPDTPESFFPCHVSNSGTNLLIDYAKSSSTAVDVTQRVNDQQLQQERQQSSSPTNKNESPVNLSGHTKLDFSNTTSNWMSEVQNKAEEWLHSSASQLHGIPFPFPPMPGAGTSSSVLQPPSAIYMPSLSPFALPESNQQSGQLMAAARSLNQPPIRIFNPDAYCDLCNKEFCNKYFLKTHKANKHGIYSDPPSSEVALPGSMYVATFATATATANMKITAQAPVPMPTQSIVEPTPLLRVVDTSPKPTLVGLLLTVSCDICQKKFTNRYIMKKHKSKVHGIPDEGECENELIRLERNCSEPSASDTNLLNQVDLQPDTDNLPSPTAGIPAQTVSMSTNETEPAQEDYGGLEQEETSFTPTPRKLSPLSSQQARESGFSVHRLRRLGIINPEAFCEICCKEYCNKYFLRTHKMKRHGIIIPEDNIIKDGHIESTVATNNSSHIQTSPLNLIMSEQNTNSSESCGEKKELKDEDMCSVCGMHFHSRGLLEVHCVTVHPETVFPTNRSMTGARTPSPTNEETGSEILTNNNGTTTATVPTAVADSISEDLQKLQTMILQLNDLNVSQTMTCHVCNKELENKLFLQAHMMTEHGMLFNETSDEQKADETRIAALSPAALDNVCKVCDSEFGTSQALKQHIQDCHNNANSRNVTTPTVQEHKEDSAELNIGTVNAVGVNADRSHSKLNQFNPTVPERRASSSHLAPTSSYCEICNKELCNKYFMKTHMQRMHGIEIENGAQIGGVVCNICNKELCSKYFLRVHKHNTHGIVEDVTSLPQPRQNNDEFGQSCLPSQSIGGESMSVAIHNQNADVSTMKSSDLGDLSHRYFTHFTEVCPICSRRFRSTKWLKAHLLADHGKIGQDKWNELELLYQNNSKMAIGNSRHTIPQKFQAQLTEGIRSPTIKVPNGGQEYDNQKPGIHNVLSNLFGADEYSSKNYYCSYCNFSTPVLAFLFVHERSHSQASFPNENDKNVSSQCPVCLQNLGQPDVLQHHILTQHSLSNIQMHPFFNSNNATGKQPIADNRSSDSKTPDIKEPTGVVGESDSGDVNNKGMAVVIKQEHPPQRTPVSAVLAPENQQLQGQYKCTQCGHVSVNMTKLYKHIRKEHKISTPPEVMSGNSSHSSVSNPPADLGQSLTDVAKQNNLPTTYALPQDAARYTMQPFLLEESSCAGVSVGVGVGTGNGAVNCVDTHQFVPSLVFLPVRERLTTPLTVTFSLTPA